MNIFAKAFCRTFQAGFRAALPILPYREPKVIDSCDGIKKVIEKEKIKSVLIVTDKGIMQNGLVQPVVDAYLLAINHERTHYENKNCCRLHL